MKGSIQVLNIGGYHCSLYLPPEYVSEGYRYPVVYISGGDDLPNILDVLEPHFDKDCQAFILLSIVIDNRNDDLTPWPAPALSNKSSAFGGKADVYLDTLVNNIKPLIDTHYRTKPDAEYTTLLGYSLGGLTALYALYTHAAFGKIGSLSGSLWYENWVEFMAAHEPVVKPARVYMSLGKKEVLNKNPRMGAIGDCTDKSVALLERQLTNDTSLTFEWNDGGHFTEIPQRFCRALLWLMRT